MLTARAAIDSYAYCTQRGSTPSSDVSPLAPGPAPAPAALAPASAARLSRGPIMVCVLPLPVWPNAKIVTLQCATEEPVTEMCRSRQGRGMDGRDYSSSLHWLSSPKAL